MKPEEMRYKVTEIKKDMIMSMLESIAISLIAMVLIFGLGFVFPDINPYVVIKWIVYVAAGFFLFAWIGNLVRWGMILGLESKLLKKGKK